MKSIFYLTKFKNKATITHNKRINRIKMESINIIIIIKMITVFRIAILRESLLAFNLLVDFLIPLGNKGARFSNIASANNWFRIHCVR